MTSDLRLAAGLVSLVSLTAALALAPAPAQACGGTFCDVGPMDQPNMPVNQTGETILFVLGEDYTEAHIQIEYDPDTDAQNFAWLIPVTAVPVFEVGSQQLFLNLLNSTVPSFGYMTTLEPCGDATASDSASATCGGGGTSSSTSDGGTDGGTTGDPPPDILLRETVGAFDIVVLQDTDAANIVQWLGDNGFYQDPKATPILQEYIDDGYLFAAMRLTHDAEVAQIHPITVTVPGNEPCVPLKLTRIAAEPYMQIRAFFLAEGKVGPSNYKHVVVNDVRWDWVDFVDNYKNVVSLAVDEAPADGHAFVTEYAGDSVVVDQGGLFSDAWDGGVFLGAAATEVYDLLAAQGLIECDNTACLYNHALLQGILAQFLPIPDGLTDHEFYGCLTCYDGLIDADAWDPVAFSLAIQERIIDPGEHALNILSAWPTLTRLYTTLSPEEMTVDPFFHENADLPAVDLRQATAGRTIPCSSAPIWTLPSGRSLAFYGMSWPVFSDEMPYALRIETVPPAGPPQVDLDNGDLIDQLLKMFSLLPQTTPRGGTCSYSDTDDTDPFSGSETVNTTAATESGGPDSSAGGSAGQGDESGCACRSDDLDPLAPAALVVVLGGAIGRRRRRR
ncbi:MAG: DUF2330 domain-containing protein [Nannocystaceae bacterium]